MEAVCSKSDCYGCSACYNVCPVKCVSMLPDDEGFLYPVIDQEKCTDCGECISVCQVHQAKKISYGSQKYYAVKHSDEVRLASSSGGAFTALSDHILENNGVIVGAVLKSDFTVCHVIAGNSEERDLLRGSKYVQSNLNLVFTEIKELLARDRQVLFVGTPCQVSGLRLFLRNDAANLYTCDFPCHGVGSPGVFRDFISFIRGKRNDELVDFKFRDKCFGWRGYTVSASFKNQEIISLKPNTLWLKSYNFLFSQNLINRLACSDCKYATLSRCSDITIGDYWGIEKYYPDFEDNLGVSCLIINSKKGENLFQLSCEKLEKIEVNKNQVQQNSLRGLSRRNMKRDDFWRLYREKFYEKAINKYGDNNLRGFMKYVFKIVTG